MSVGPLRGAVARRDGREAYELLFAGYRERTWWFEALVLLRQVLVAIFGSVLPRDSAFALPTLQATLIGYMVAVLYFQPFHKALAARADVAACFMALITVAMANKTARIAWALMAKGETYRAPAAAG